MARKRNNICNTDDHTDQNRIWGSDDRCSNITQYTDNCGIQDLSADKSTKGFMRKTHGMNKKGCPFGWKNCINSHFCLGNKSLFIRQYIKRYDRSNKEILQKTRRSRKLADIFFIINCIWGRIVFVRYSCNLLEY